MSELASAYELKSRKFWSQPYSYLVFFIFPVLIVAVWFSPRWVAQAVVMALIAWAAWEWAVFTGLKKISTRLLYIIGILFLILFIRSISQYMDPTPPAPSLIVKVLRQITPLVLVIMSIILVIWSKLAVMRYRRGMSPLGFQCPWVRACFGVLVLLAGGFFTLGLVVGIHLAPWGAHMRATGLVLIWSIGVGSYLGQYYGKRLLSERLDSFKTRASFWGSYFFFSIVALFVLFFSGYLEKSAWETWSNWLHTSIFFFIFLVLVGWVAMGGDLLSRMIKKLNTKDGETTTLPRHTIPFYMNGLLAGLSMFALYMELGLFLAELIGIG